MSELTSDSALSDNGTVAAETDGEFELAADLDEDLLASDEPRPSAPDNSATPNAEIGTPDEPRPATHRAPSESQVRNVTDLDQLDITSASQREKNLLADYTRKTQAAADQRRANDDRQRLLDAREAQLAVMAAPQGPVDPLATLRSTLSPDEARALDVVQELNRQTLGTQMDQYGQDQEKLTNVVKLLATHLLHGRAESANNDAAEARALYPEIDAYTSQVSALTAVANPATRKNYTPKEAYELLTGVSASRSAQLTASDTQARTGAAAATNVPASAVSANAPSGELSPAEVTDGLRALGFE